MPRTRTHGRPGRSAILLARRRAARTAGGVAIAISLIGLGGASGLWPVTIAGLAVGGLAIRTGRPAIHRARVGAAAEQQVARRLRSVRCEALLFDVGVGPGDVDVVVLGPMAAAVEVKRAAGRVRVRRDGVVTAAGRRLPGFPARQAIAGAAGLRRRLGGPGWIEPILCITEMRGPPRRTWVGDHEVWVTSARDLPRTLRRMPSALAPGEGAALADRLVKGDDASIRRLT